MNHHATKLELHYFFKDDSHTMNAVIRNKCEFELLHLMNEIADIFDVHVIIETEAYGEGGLKEIWSFVGKNSNQITIVLLILTLALSRLPVESEDPLEPLKKEEIQLSIEEKKLKIQKLKQELKQEASVDIEEVIDEVIDELNSHIKILKHKSNFYNNLVHYEKITKISAAMLDDNYRKIEKEKTVLRKDFNKFILKTDVLKPEVDDEAVVEIVAPVLKSGNYKWKGIYNKESISFYLKDKDFKTSVLKGGVHFKHGTFIKCVVEMDRKVSSIGEIIISGHSVTTVISKYDDVESIDTPQGKQYLRNKKAKKNQLTVFDYKK